MAKKEMVGKKWMDVKICAQWDIQLSSLDLSSWLTCMLRETSNKSFVVTFKGSIGGHIISVK